MNTLNYILEKTVKLSAENIKTDSRRARPGDIFIAIKGFEYDGHDYVMKALRKGVSRVVCEKMPDSVPPRFREKITVVKNARETLGHIARRVFKNPSKKLAVYGVTGTNGKTTTTFLIDSILNNASVKCGLISTVFTRARGDDFARSSMTTPDIMTLNRLLAEMVSGGRKAAALEISSHALSQNRVGEIGLDSAVFTNITPEHLDYHKDMGTYLKDKAKIFRNLKPGGTGALNRDDPFVAGLAGAVDIPRLITFGVDCSAADVRAENISLSVGKTEFDLIAGKLGSVRVYSALTGKYNVYNILAAVAALLNSGLSLIEIKEGIETASLVPGRLDAVCEEALPFRVFVDYAHTPDALKNVLGELRSMTEGRLICVFGCGGDRDRKKRPLMGALASKISDHVILTNDNPRGEDPVEILSDIEKGIPRGASYTVIPDRRIAIRESLETARKGDIVIIAGKGHEDYQQMSGKTIRFNDKEVAHEALLDLGY